MARERRIDPKLLRPPWDIRGPRPSRRTYRKQYGPLLLTFTVSGDAPPALHLNVMRFCLRGAWSAVRALMPTVREHGSFRNREHESFADFITVPHWGKAGEVASHLGMRIRTRRLLLGWTLKVLSRRAGLNLAHLSEVERGLHRPTRRIRRRIHRALLIGEWLEQPVNKLKGLLRRLGPVDRG